MNELDEIKNTYKPYRLTKKKNVTIIDSTSGSFVIKKDENNKVNKAYTYLLSRNFDYFPPLVNNLRGLNVYQYIDEIETPKEQKALDMIDLVALMHNKTTYYKEVSEDEFKKIYDNLKNNIMYAEEYYNELYNEFIEEIIPSPSHYLILRNIYKIFAAINFCNEQLDNWYDLVSKEKKSRVAFIHNNLEIDHFIRNTEGYLISFDKSRIDMPILDLITFYQKEYMDLNFETIFKRYMDSYSLNPGELKLLMLVISIPPIIEMKPNEFLNVKNIREKLDYIFKTENLVQAFNDEDK